MKAGVFEAMVQDLRELLRVLAGQTEQPGAVILDSRPLHSSLGSGHRAGYDRGKRKKGSKVHLAVDSLGQQLALHVILANEHDRRPVEVLVEQVQPVTSDPVEVAVVDQADTGEQAAQDAAAHGLRLEVVKLPEAKKGFVLLPRRWVVERSFGAHVPISPLSARLRAVS